MGGRHPMRLRVSQRGTADSATVTVASASGEQVGTAFRLGTAGIAPMRMPVAPVSGITRVLTPGRTL